jgi:hypothetical protein
MKAFLSILCILCLCTGFGFSQVCTPSTVIAMPFVKDGAGQFCFETTCIGTPINSWNLTQLTINGVDFTNKWADASAMPSPVNGKYYIVYNAAYAWSHFEAAGSCAGNTAAPTSVPTVAPTAISTAAPTAIPTAAPTPVATPSDVPAQYIPYLPTADMVSLVPSQATGQMFVDITFPCPSYRVADPGSVAVAAGVYPDGTTYLSSITTGTKLEAYTGACVQVLWTTRITYTIAYGDTTYFGFYVFYNGMDQLVKSITIASSTTAPTAVPTSVPTAVPTLETTAVPTAVSTVTPEVTPLPSPIGGTSTPATTATPTPAPTVAPTVAPTAAPTTGPKISTTLTNGYAGALPQQISCNTVDISVVLKDANGAPLAGKIVSWTSQSSIQVAASQSTTDSNGIAANKLAVACDGVNSHIITTATATFAGDATYNASSCILDVDIYSPMAGPTPVATPSDAPTAIPTAEITSVPDCITCVLPTAIPPAGGEPDPTPPMLPTQSAPPPFPTGAGAVTMTSSSYTVKMCNSFTLNVSVDSGTQSLAAYGFTIAYNSATIAINTCTGTSGVTAGADGFVTAVNASNPGSLVISGFDTTGKGPGTSLAVLSVSARALAYTDGTYYDGYGYFATTRVTLTVNTLVDPSTVVIGVPQSLPIEIISYSGNYVPPSPR